MSLNYTTSLTSLGSQLGGGWGAAAGAVVGFAIDAWNSDKQAKNKYNRYSNALNKANATIDYNLQRLSTLSTNLASDINRRYGSGVYEAIQSAVRGQNKTSKTDFRLQNNVDINTLKYAQKDANGNQVESAYENFWGNISKDDKLNHAKLYDYGELNTDTLSYDEALVGSGTMQNILDRITNGTLRDELAFSDVQFNELLDNVFGQTTNAAMNLQSDLEQLQQEYLTNSISADAQIANAQAQQAASGIRGTGTGAALSANQQLQKDLYNVMITTKAESMLRQSMYEIQTARKSSILSATKMKLDTERTVQTMKDEATNTILAQYDNIGQGQKETNDMLRYAEETEKTLNEVGGVDDGVWNGFERIFESD